MDDDMRAAAVLALASLGRGSDYRDRADAGRALASFADRREAAAMLRELLLDADDTFVTRATAEALLRRKDRAGLAAVASALAAADADHADWMCTAADDVFGVFTGDRDEAVLICEALVRDAGGADEGLALGARQLLDVLGGMDPVFHTL